eukprot:TRINITY_DN1745_c2_g1_i1.p1 TRINITY_DN1745_c2_g1~~TRINITY_DN1745_c2_g1_i1.p1  ORF type:complete len:685 (+),score=202.28 TRINITY_DN1745_c2_g1_i1:58-2112(+)
MGTCGSQDEAPTGASSPARRWWADSCESTAGGAGGVPAAPAGSDGAAERTAVGGGGGVPAAATPSDEAAGRAAVGGGGGGGGGGEEMNFRSESSVAAAAEPRDAASSEPMNTRSRRSAPAGVASGAPEDGQAAAAAQQRSSGDLSVPVNTRSRRSSAAPEGRQAVEAGGGERSEPVNTRSRQSTPARVAAAAEDGQAAEAAGGGERSEPVNTSSRRRAAARAATGGGERSEPVNTSSRRSAPARAATGAPAADTAQQQRGGDEPVSARSRRSTAARAASAAAETAQQRGGGEPASQPLRPRQAAAGAPEVRQAVGGGGRSEPAHTSSRRSAPARAATGASASETAQQQRGGGERSQPAAPARADSGTPATEPANTRGRGAGSRTLAQLAASLQQEVDILTRLEDVRRRLHKFACLSAGSTHGLVVLPERIAGWGQESSFLGAPAVDSRRVWSVHAGNRISAVLADGVLKVWGAAAQDYECDVRKLNADVVHASASLYSEVVAAVGADGDLHLLGPAKEDVPGDLRGQVAAAACGWGLIAVLTRDGAVSAFGSGCGRFTPQLGERKATAVSAGAMFFAALLDDGSVRCFQTSAVSGPRAVAASPRLTDAVEVQCGADFVVARRQGGSLVCWGEQAKALALPCCAAFSCSDHAVVTVDSQGGKAMHLAATAPASWKGSLQLKTATV